MQSVKYKIAMAKTRLYFTEIIVEWMKPSLIERCAHKTGFSQPILPLGWSFLLLSSSGRRIVSYRFYIYWCWMIFYGLLMVFECVFTNSFTFSGLVCQTLLSPYTGCFLGCNFPSMGRCFCWYNYIFGCSGLLVCLIIFCYVY